MTATTTGVERGSEPPPEQPGHPPLLSLTAAARTAGVSRSTLRRRLAEGAFRGAQRDAQGAWLVPVADLIQAGLSPAVTPPMSTPVNGVVSLPDIPAKVAQLEAELAAERLKRELASGWPPSASTGSKTCGWRCARSVRGRPFRSSATGGRGGRVNGTKALARWVEATWIKGWV